MTEFYVIFGFVYATVVVVFLVFFNKSKGELSSLNRRVKLGKLTKLKSQEIRVRKEKLIKSSWLFSHVILLFLLLLQLLLILISDKASAIDLLLVFIEYGLFLFLLILVKKLNGNYVSIPKSKGNSTTRI